MGIFSKGYKATAVFDAAGIPTGLSGVVPASAMDGAIGAITGIADGGTTVYFGAAKTVGEIVKVAAVAMGTSKYVTGNLVPRKQF